jgi:hypothetical protein
MGNSWSSSSQSYLQYKNDFELVIRATKDLEFLLETQFGAPSTNQTGLHDKITHAQQSAGLPQETIKKMRYLVTSKYVTSCLSLHVSLKTCQMLTATATPHSYNNSSKQNGTRTWVQLLTRSSSFCNVL